MAYQYRLAVIDHSYSVPISARKCIWIYLRMKIAQIPTLSHVQIEKGAIQLHSITATPLINL